MKKYLSLLKYELKTVLRDPVNLFMCLFPVIVLILSCYVFPLIMESVDPTKGMTLQITMLLLLVIILAFDPFFLRLWLLSFAEQKDENTLHTIAVTPLGTSGYLKFKMTYIYIVSVIGIIAILLGTKLIAGDKYAIGGKSLFDNINAFHILSFAVINGLFTPALGMLQAAFAKNKVEGFAFIKGTGILALIPALMILEAFQGGLQYVLGIFPNFWAIKGMVLELMPYEHGANLSFPFHLLIGGVYNIFLLVLAYRYFVKRAQYE